MAHEQTNYSYGEVAADQPSNHTSATPAEITAIARQIWKKITVSKIKTNDDNGNDKLLKEFQNEFKDFSTSFPLVLRWMVQMRKFNSKAFERYLLKHASAKLDTREAFLELQAEYLVLLYREEHLHNNDEKFIKTYRASIIKQLLDEDKIFIDLQKQVESEIALNTAAIDSERKQQLYAFLLNKKLSESK